LARFLTTQPQVRASRANPSSSFQHPSRRSGASRTWGLGLDSPDAVLRGTLGVSCSPKPSTGGAECPPKGVEMARLSVGTWCGKPGPTQRNLREPGQVREEAALSGRFRVPWGCRAGAGDRSEPRDPHSTAGCTALLCPSHGFAGVGVCLPGSLGWRRLWPTPVGPPPTMTCLWVRCWSTRMGSLRRRTTTAARNFKIPPPTPKCWCCRLPPDVPVSGGWTGTRWWSRSSPAPCARGLRWRPGWSGSYTERPTSRRGRPGVSTTSPKIGA